MAPATIVDPGATVRSRFVSDHCHAAGAVVGFRAFFFMSASLVTMMISQPGVQETGSDLVHARRRPLGCCPVRLSEDRRQAGGAVVHSAGSRRQPWNSTALTSEAPARAAFCVWAWMHHGHWVICAMPSAVPELTTVKKSHAAPRSSGTFGRATYSERRLKDDGVLIRGVGADKVVLQDRKAKKRERASEVITVEVTEKEASALGGMMKACGLKTRSDLFWAAAAFLWAAVDARKRGGWLVASSRKKCFMMEMPALSSVSYIPDYPKNA
jgi:hypothetical protein